MLLIGSCVTNAKVNKARQQAYISFYIIVCCYTRMNEISYVDVSQNEWLFTIWAISEKRGKYDIHIFYDYDNTISHCIFSSRKHSKHKYSLFSD